VRCRFLILCVTSVFFAIGCASTRRTAPPVAPETALSQESLEVLEDSTASLPEGPTQRGYRLLRQAFREEQAGRGSRALCALDSAACVLADLVTSASDTLTPARLAGLVRITLELYQDLLPPVAPIASHTPLAHLMDALPGDATRTILHHPYYRAFRIRILAATADVPIDYTPGVAQSIRYFQTDARQVFSRWLSRSRTYMPMLRQIFRDAGLPEDLAYQAMIESGFKPYARSRARAVGLWQFVRHTARLYGLKNNTWVDERRDPEKSTRAAARHIQHLYDLFGDWRLVVAAYNCGQGRLGRAMQKSNTRDYWKLEGLPRETRNHVPRFMAAVLISKDPEWFGFNDVVYQDALAYDVVQVSECVDLKIAAECAGVAYNWVRELNAELHQGYTPPDAKIYPLRVPVGTAERFRANYAHVPPERKMRIVRYRVRSGDTIYDIARDLGVSQRAILDANGIRNPRGLRAGTWIKIPLRPSVYNRATGLAGRQTDAAPDPSRRIRIIYTVKPGDTLWDIARREGVTPEHIRVWNNLAPSRYILPGNQLVVWKPVPAPGSDAPDAISEAAGGAFYTVKRGDTLWEIARAFHTSVSNLRKWNGISRRAHILPGTKLRVRQANRPEAE